MTFKSRKTKATVAFSSILVVAMLMVLALYAKPIQTYAIGLTNHEQLVNAKIALVERANVEQAVYTRKSLTQQDLELREQKYQELMQDKSLEKSLLEVELNAIGIYTYRDGTIDDKESIKSQPADTTISGVSIQYDSNNAHWILRGEWKWNKDVDNKPGGIIGQHHGKDYIQIGGLNTYGIGFSNTYGVSQGLGVVGGSVNATNNHYGAGSNSNRVTSVDADKGVAYQLQDNWEVQAFGSPSLYATHHDHASGYVEVRYNSIFANYSGNAAFFVAHTWDDNYTVVNGIEIQADGSFKLNWSSVKEEKRWEAKSPQDTQF